MRDHLCTAMSIVCIALACLPIVIASLSVDVQAQETRSVTDWLTLVNDVRLDEGLDPYSLSKLLTTAAQRHADDIANNGFPDPQDVHEGSDGTHEQERIAEAGYVAWTRDGDEPIADENLWAGLGTINDAMSFFLEDPAHRDNILSDVYREIGIGIATDAEGQNYYVLDFGARPNVLPVFLNDGAASADNREIALRLTNERARPGGRGAELMGEAIEIRISNGPKFDEEPWRPWTQLVPWTLPSTPGEHTVYVRFRDAAGRTATSADSIILEIGTPASSTSTPTSAHPSLSREPSATSVPPDPTIAATATVFPTAAPRPSPSAPISFPLAPDSLSPIPTPSVPAPSVTPFPTWTPLPCPGPTSPTPRPPGIDGYGKVLGIAAALQGLALILGLYLALRRDGRA